MNNESIKLRRREFLTGAATAIGVGALGTLPSLGAAQAIGTGPGSPGLLLLFWNGSQFIPAANAIGATLANDSVLVRIESFGTSPGIAAIDIRMPGGVFEGFTARPRGQKAVLFPAPVAPGSSLTLRVTDGVAATIIALHTGSTPGPKLAFGTYLLTDVRVQSTQLVLTASTDAPVISPDGQPVSIPYVLITISE